MKRRRRLRGDRGSVIVVHLAVFAAGMIILTVLLQLVMWQYGRAAVRDALDEGVRAGAPLEHSTADCEQRARQVMESLMRGPLANVRIKCTATPTQMLATADVTMHSWLSPMPDWTFTVTASAAKELA